MAATAGHHKVVEILLDHAADIEAQSERTKDTPLSLACSGGRYEVGICELVVHITFVNFILQASTVFDVVSSFLYFLLPFCFLSGGGPTSTETS